MTTGTNKVLQPYSKVSFSGYPNMTYGTEVLKSWSGGDAITGLKPRSSFPDGRQYPARTVTTDTRAYGMVRYGGRDHFQRLGKRPKKTFRAKEVRTSEGKVVLWDPHQRRWRSVKESQAEESRSAWIKKYHAKKALTPNDYSMTKTTTVRSIWQCYDGTLLNTVPIGNTGWPTLVYDVSNEYKLIEKLRKKIYGSGFNPGIFLVEAPKAIQMIGNAAYRFGAALYRFLKGDWRGMFDAFGIEPKPVHRTRALNGTLFNRRHSMTDTQIYQVLQAKREISKLWLELSYGWKPLLSDMEEGAAWLAYALNPPPFSGGKVMGRREWKVHHYKREKNYGSLTYMDRETRYRLQIVIHGVVVSPSFSTPSLPGLAGAAWEKLPYSFVLDWALPISSYLQALRTSRDIKGTVIRTLTTERIHTNISPGGTGYNEYRPKMRLAGTDDKTTIYQLSRSVTSEIQVPNPLSALFDGHAVFSDWRRTANAVALLGSGNIRALSQGFSTQR